MTTPVEKLTKILHLEAESYQDRAVLGGLTRFAATWIQEARPIFGQSANPWIQEIAELLRSYSKLSGQQERSNTLEQLLKLLEQGPSAPPSPPPASPPPATPTTSPTPAPREMEPEGLKASLTVLRGVGNRQSERLSRLGLTTVRDLLFLLPHRYDDYSNLKPINRLEYDQEATIIAQVQEARVQKTRKGASLFKVVLTDGTGFIQVTWFNQPYLIDRIKPGQQIAVSGKVSEYMGRLSITSPEWEPLRRDLLHTGRLVPVYPLTEGVTARWLRQLVKRTVDYWAPRLPDHLPPSIKQEHDLLDLGTALQQAHFPENSQSLEKGRYRLAFDELFIFQLGLLRQRHQWRATPGRELPIDDSTLQSFVLNLPFQLTGAQQRTLNEIVSDMRSPHPMNRLVQGDVGSGKTIVAAAAMALAVTAGTQAALMAPTEILAEQHYHTLTRIFANWPGQSPTIRLLTGRVTGAEREEIYNGLAQGSIDIAVGTHALIQQEVAFRDLAFVVIDEQHRFGVRQRAALRQKGQQGSSPYNPHMMVMTATPIPRSLQLTLWGHLDVSIIDEMPPGRQPIDTKVITPSARERAYAFVRNQVEKGHQAFIIYPLVEESEKIEAKAAVKEHKRLQKEIFGDFSLGLLHGRMKSEEKERVMAAFSRGELDILVATSVVEVGIDVPNATVMFIEGAERFGLAQLHQFRGRVGRGEYPSYCLLVAESNSEEAEKRLLAVEETTDGFVLAQKDLDMRGPGEFLGTRQSGFPDLKTASLANLKLLETAREAARRFSETDPELSHPEHQALAYRVNEMWKKAGEVS